MQMTKNPFHHGNVVIPTQNPRKIIAGVFLYIYISLTDEA